MTASSLVTSMATPCTSSLPKVLREAVDRRVERRLVDIGEHDAGAFGEKLVRDGRADAAGAAGDERDAAGKALGLRHALELRFLEQPVFDVEGLLLGQADIVCRRRRRRASH